MKVRQITSVPFPARLIRPFKPIPLPMLHTNKQLEVEILLIGNYAEYTKAIAVLDTSSSSYFI